MIARAESAVTGGEVAGSATREGIGVSGFTTRLAVALVLVYATFNPWGWSYVHWLLGTIGSDDPASLLASPAAKFVAGVVLAIGWIVYANAARSSLGGVGISLVIALCAGVIWLLVDQEVVTARSVPMLTHLGLLVVALVLAIGLSWSHVRRRLTGQVDTDEVDD
jgi:hypothetical protein